MGHSWGGGLSAAYLLDSNNQQHISGWIEIDGAHNLKDGNNWSIDWVISKANERINEGIDENKWQREINWYNNFSGQFTYNDFIERHLNNVWDLGGYFYDPSIVIKTPIWTSPIPLFSHFILYVTRNFYVSELNLSPEMNKITIPSLILWGRHDGSLPVELAANAYDNLGTPGNEKHIHIFENSGHVPFVEEEGIFIVRVKEFVNKYNLKKPLERYCEL
jgi:pimeloyl-ACP methyl ester carboxylesterase